MTVEADALPASTPGARQEGSAARSRLAAATPLETDTTRVLDGIRRIVQALRASSRLAEKQVGLSGAQLFVLQRLATGPALTLNDLANATHTHQSSVSTVAARLIQAGLVRRTRSATDGRSINLRITPRGQRRLAGAPDLVQGRLIHGLERMTPARRRSLASTLSELVGSVDVITVAADAPAMFFEDPNRAVKRRRRSRVG